MGQLMRLLEAKAPYWADNLLLRRNVPASSGDTEPSAELLPS